MGVKNLHKYLENNCPNGTEKVNLNTLIRLRKTRSHRPTIVVDVSSCVKYFYAGLDVACGGQLKEFHRRLSNFADTIQRIGGTLVACFDGTRAEDKQEKWIEKREKNIIEIMQLFKEINDLSGINAMRVLNHTLLVRVALTAFSQASRCCEVMQSIHNHGRETVTCAKEHGAVGILAQNSDFLIYEGDFIYLSAKYLDTETLDTIMYNKTALLHNLKLNQSQIPVFASLVGNDIVNHRLLTEFHRGIRNEDDEYLNVALFTQKLPTSTEDIINYVKHNEYFNKKLRVKLKYSLQNYTHEKKETEKGFCSDWDQVVHLACQKHKSCEIPSSVYNVMKNFTYYSCEILEDFHDSLPLIEPGLSSLRKKIYGILLKEKPGSSYCVVKEFYIAGKTRITCDDQQYTVNIENEKIMPFENHPGLKVLWEDKKTNFMRWRLFYSTISSRIIRSDTKCLSPCMVLPTAALFYLFHVCCPMYIWEVEAFMIQAVQLQSIRQNTLNDIKIPRLNTRAIQLAAKFVRVCNEIEFLNAACGMVIRKEYTCPARYFDGLLFHETYLKMEKEKSVAAFSLTDNSLIEYNLIRRVVLKN